MSEITKEEEHKIDLIKILDEKYAKKMVKAQKKYDKIMDRLDKSLIQNDTPKAHNQWHKTEKLAAAECNKTGYYLHKHYEKEKRIIDNDQ